MKNKFYLNSQLNFFQQIHLFLSMITIRILIRKKRHNYENNLINNLMMNKNLITIRLEMKKLII